MKYKLTIIILLFAICLSTTFIIKAKGNEFSLNGYVIYVDAGHGGKDNGANNNGILEDSINLNISKFLVGELIDRGAYVYTSRDADYDLASNYDKNRKAKDLKRRVELINKIKPDLFISIHLNTYSNTSVSGGQVFYQDNEESKNLALILQSAFNTLSRKNKKPKLGDYYLLNKSNSIGVIVECGFLTNKDDLSNLIKDDYQNKIAILISESIYKYFKDKN